MTKTRLSKSAKKQILNKWLRANPPGIRILTPETPPSHARKTAKAIELIARFKEQRKMGDQRGMQRTASALFSFAKKITIYDATIETYWLKHERRWRTQTTFHKCPYATAWPVFTLDAAYAARATLLAIEIRDPKYPFWQH